MYSYFTHWWPNPPSLRKIVVASPELSNYGECDFIALFCFQHDTRRISLCLCARLDAAPIRTLSYDTPFALSYFHLRHTTLDSVFPSSYNVEHVAQHHCDKRYGCFWLVGVHKLVFRKPDYLMLTCLIEWATLYWCKRL